jgi:hypothetical protein
VVLENRMLALDESTKKRIRDGAFVVRGDWSNYGRSEMVHVPPEYWDASLTESPALRLYVDLPKPFGQGDLTLGYGAPIAGYNAEERQRLTLVNALAEPESPVDTPGSPDDEAQEEPAKEVRFERKVRYTVDYYEKSQYNAGNEFLYTYSADKAFIDSLWNTPELAPVLEETHDVVYQRARNRIAPGHPLRPNPNLLPGVEASEKWKIEPGDSVRLPSVQIHSPLIRNALGAVVKYRATGSSQLEPYNPYGKQPEQEDTLGGGLFKYPFRDLYYHKKELLEFKAGNYACCVSHPEEYQRECGEHIDLLIGYLYAQPDIGLAAAELGWARKVPTTNFASFWLLMKPGSDVYVRKNDRLNAFVVDSVEGGITFFERGRIRKVEPYRVKLWGLWFDGVVVSRMQITIEVPVFDNERDIRSLPVFPVEFQDKEDNGATRQQLIARGKKFFKCCRGPAYMEYSGLGFAGRASKVRDRRFVC